jgi:CO/xanthine dehydrogenase Mo-binding subunit
VSSPFALDRRTLLKSGGALVIAFSLASPLMGENTERGLTPGPPDARNIDTWLVIHQDNTATLYMGFAELGQGATTALPQVAAEELDMATDAISTVQLDTNITPNQGGTYSSSAIHRGAPQVRIAAAEARMSLLNMAARRLGVAVSDLSVSNGVVSGGGHSVSYGELVGGRRLDIPFNGNAPLKKPSEYRVVGQSVPRKDMRAKADGSYTYIQHLKLPGMLHARIVRPRGQRAYQAGATPLRVDENSIRHIPSAQVLRKGNFIGVVAEREWDAVEAARQLKVVWDDARTLPPDLFEAMRSSMTEDRVVMAEGNAAGAFEAAAVTAVSTCHAPYQSHAPFAPNCALADVRTNSALVICTSQDIYNTRTAVATVLEREPQSVRVQYAPASGTYGKSCYDDAAQAAAIMSRLAGKPVRLQFMRWDELGWDLYGPAHIGEARAAADDEGRITAYEYHGWAHHWSLVETSQQLALGTSVAEWPFPVSQEVNPLVCGGMYAIANRLLVNHRVPGKAFLRGGWLRSPLDLAFAFISEQAIDDLAHALDRDPYRFRKANMADARWEAVLDAVAEAAGWRDGNEGSKSGDTAMGRGIGLGTHLASRGAAVADIEVNRRTGHVRVMHLYGAIDAGLVVNPGIVKSQIIGQLVQTASRMLYEEVTFDGVGVTSLDWDSYSVQRFADCPEVTPIVMQAATEPSTGAGEEVMAAAAAAIANAFFDATGQRMRMFPFTPEHVLDTLTT